jgi:hypothetical protein
MDWMWMSVFVAHLTLFGWSIAHLAVTHWDFPAHHLYHTGVQIGTVWTGQLNALVIVFFHTFLSLLITGLVYFHLSYNNLARLSQTDTSNKVINYPHDLRKDVIWICSSVQQGLEALLISAVLGTFDVLTLINHFFTFFLVWFIAHVMGKIIQQRKYYDITHPNKLPGGTFTQIDQTEEQDEEKDIKKTGMTKIPLVPFLIVFGVLIGKFFIDVMISHSVNPIALTIPLSLAISLFVIQTIILVSLYFPGFEETNPNELYVVQQCIAWITNFLFLLHIQLYE